MFSTSAALALFYVLMTVLCAVGYLLKFSVKGYLRAQVLMTALFGLTVLAGIAQMDGVVSVLSYCLAAVVTVPLFFGKEGR